MRRLWVERNGGVTEKNWQAFTHPGDLLFYLEGNVSDRKLRLFACYCYRHFCNDFGEETSRQAVLVSERFVEGLATADELRDAYESTAFVNIWGEDWIGSGAGGAAAAAAAAASLPVRAAAVSRSIGAAPKDLAWQRALLDELFGNPFRVPRIEPAWLRWNAGTVPKLAEAIYEERVFDRLPVLADALEDAGCADADILGHCRSGGEHVRGCWVVDLVLGRR
jgi:hypothetical protein